MPQQSMQFRHFVSVGIILLAGLQASSCANDAGLGGQPGPPAETPRTEGDGASGTITVNPETTYQTMDGFGTSMRLWDDPHLNGLSPAASSGGLIMTQAEKDTVYDLLYSPDTGIGLNRIRTGVIVPGWQTEEGAKIVADAPFPGPHATDVLDFIQQARRRNAELETGFQIGLFDSWVSVGTDPFAIARYIKTGLDYARLKGHEPDWVGIHNEPSLGAPNFSGENLRDITIALKRLLEADRYSTKVSAPDDVVDGLGAPKAAIILADPTARSFVKALSIHLYGDISPTEIASLAQKYALPLWMTEYDDQLGGNEIGWASAIVHEMIVTYNCSAVDMLFGFLGSQAFGNPYATYITLKSTGTKYDGYTLNPSYYQMGHWSKYVKRGSIRIGAASTNPNVKVSAFMTAGKKVIVLIHEGKASESVRIPPGTYTAIRTQMSGSDRLANKGVFNSTLALPGSSITTLLER